MTSLRLPAPLARVAPYAGLVALAGVLALYPELGPTGRNLSLATSALVFAIAASGLGFLWGQAGQLTAAHAATVGVGAYTAALLADQHGMGFGASLGLAVAAGAVAGLVVALPALRTGGSYFVILTFAIGQVAVSAATRLDSLTGGLSGVTVIAGQQEVLGLRLGDRSDFFRGTVLLFLLSLSLLLFLRRSRWGTTLRGIRENADLARSLGTNVTLHRTAAFMVGGAVAGLAGQLYVYNVRFIQPQSFGFNLAIFFVLMVLLGGRTYLLGPTVGAFVYVFLPEGIFLSPVRSQMVLGLILVALVLVLPDGLLSLGVRIRTWWQRRGAAQRIESSALAPSSDGAGGRLEAVDPRTVPPATEPATVGEGASER